MAAAVLMGVLLGRYLDRLFGTALVRVGFFTVGGRSCH